MTAAAVEAPLDVRAAWHRMRWPALVVVLFLGLAVVLAVVQNAPPQRPLDPRDASPSGARALAELVRDRGVDVIPVAQVARLNPDEVTTVLLVDPQSLTRAALHRLASSAADLVVVAPSDRELAALGVPAKAAGGTGETTLSPRCAFGPAQVAGDVRFAGVLYRTAGPVADTACYAAHGGVGLLVHQRATGRTVVFGSPATVVNARLADQGDAALALGLLTSRPHLAWVLPQPPTRAPGDARKGLFELLPDRLLWLVLQLFVVVVLLALWRARRLGPVVVEPLPVVVRAAETVEGRARLLRAARARGTAATALRTAAVARLRDLLGVGPDAVPAAVVEGVARRTGQSGAAVEVVLYGADPADDVALVRLADELDAIENTVRRS
jgi:hypothetical protein